MRLEFSAQMRMAREATALCDFANRDLRLQQQPLRLLGPQSSQVRAHGNSEEAAEFPRKVNLVTPCFTRDLRHGELHECVLVHEFACGAKPRRGVCIGRRRRSLSAECGDNFQHDSFASDRREAILVAQFLEQLVA